MKMGEDEYLDDDESIQEPPKKTSRKNNDKQKPNLVEMISRQIVDYIATADIDPFLISVEVATMVEKAKGKKERIAIAEQIFSAGIMKIMHILYERNIQFNNYLHAFQYLAHSLTISFPDFLRILCSYGVRPQDREWENIIEANRRSIICKMLRKARWSFNCDHWTSEEYEGMRNAAPKVYKFLIECIKNSLGDYENRDRISKSEFESTFLEYFAQDVFFVNLMKLSDFEQIKNANKADRRMRTEIIETMKKFDKKNKEILFEKSDTTLSHEWNHSIVETTVCVFVSARMNVSCDEMKKDIVAAAEMVGVGELWMWKSALRSIIQLMLETRSFPLPSIRSFVEVFFLDRLPRMIDVDASTLRTLLEHTAREMQSALNKLPVYVWDLFQEQLEKNGHSIDERVNVERFNSYVPACELITRSPIALNAIEGIKSVHSTEDAISILPSLFDPSCIALNTVLAHLSIEGEIHKKTAILADVNRLMEESSNEVNGEQRWRRFDATFCLLLHTYYTVNRMTVRRMVTGGEEKSGNANGVFYRWVTRFGCRDTTPNDKRDIDNLNDEEREKRAGTGKTYFHQLLSNCSLAAHDAKYSEVFDNLPYLARFLLDEAGKISFELSTALSTLSSSPSIVYSILMWLYCLDHSEARVSLVRNMDKVMREMRGTDDTWRFMLHSSSPLVKEMLKGQRTMDCVNSSPMVAAFMIKPLRYRHEIAKAEMLKKGITVASRGNCLTPWVIDLIESGNHAAQFDWVKLWVREITKLIVMDEMTEMGELLMGAAMIAPLQICREICQVLGNRILDDSDEIEGLPRPEMAPCLFVFLSRFTAQMMMMAVWAVDHGENQLEALEYERDEGVPPEKRKKTDDEESTIVDDLEDEIGMIKAHKEELSGTLVEIFSIMQKACQRGYLRNSVSAVSLILKEIAIGPDIDCSTTLKGMVPQELLELLAFIDPLSVPFELFCAFVSDKGKRLEYLCKWKNWKGVEYPEMEEKEDEMRMEEDRRVARVL